MSVRFNRVRLRRVVYDELHRARAYRQALRKPEELTEEEAARMSAWVRVADDLLECLRQEDDGASKARFADELFGITRRPPGSARYVYNATCSRAHVSFAGARQWRDNALFTASVLAISYGAVNLSKE